MKIAYIISAFQLPEQLVRLVYKLNSSNVCFYIHVDKKARPEIFNLMLNKLKHLDNLIFLDRHLCRWGDFGHVKATLKGIDSILRRDDPVDYVMLLTAQDYPLVSNEAIKEFLDKSEKKSYLMHMPLPGDGQDSLVSDYLSSLSGKELADRLGVYKRLQSEPSRTAFWHFYLMNVHRRFPGKYLESNLRVRRVIPGGLKGYMGRSYWCLHIELIRYIDNFCKNNIDYVRFFKYAWVPDEIFFQTIIANSPFLNSVINKSLTYQQWHAGEKRNFIDEGDLDNIFDSGMVFARKFDVRRNPFILDIIDGKINK